MSNLITCDGCGKQIQAKDTLVCAGCKQNFCPECACDMYLRVVGLCDKCGEWREDIVTDCEQRKQELIVAKIKAAMEILEQSPCGNIGAHGMTANMMLAELNHGRDFDGNYHSAQMAWLELNELLEAIANA